MTLNVEALTFTNVWHFKSEYNKNGSFIAFAIGDSEYQLHMREEDDGIIYPNKIAHAEYEGGCPYCKESTPCCQELTKYKQALFHRLIEQPSIRLEWLFINHV